jgi:polar amino acid transport system substrate-binding protein
MFATCVAAPDAKIAVMIARSDVWYPFNGDPNSKMPGYVVEMCRRIYGAHGISVDYRVMSWEKSIAEVRAGRADAILGADRADAPDFVYPVEPCGYSSNFFYTLADRTWRYTGYASLRDVRIGVIKSYSYGDFLDKYLNLTGARVTKFPSDDDSVQHYQALVMGKIDVLIESSDLVVAYKLHKLGISENKLRLAGIEGESEPIYVAFSPAPNRPGYRFAGMWTDGVRIMRRDGTLRTLLEKYGVLEKRSAVDATPSLRRPVSRPSPSPDQP